MKKIMQQVQARKTTVHAVVLNRRAASGGGIQMDFAQADRGEKRLWCDAG